MSCQTTPYDKKRIVISKSELQIVEKADVDFSISLGNFFQLIGDYSTFEITLKPSTVQYTLPLDTVLVNGLMKLIWVFPVYEKTEYESTECLEWAFVDDMVWNPLSKILALSGTGDINNTTYYLRPIILRNLSGHNIKAKVIVG